MFRYNSNILSGVHLDGFIKYKNYKNAQNEQL